MRASVVLLGLLFVACDGSSPDPGEDAGRRDGASGDAGDAIDAGGSACELVRGTTETGTASPSGCAVLDRDTSACDADRAAAGIEGFWRDFSCRVTLTSTADTVRAEADGRPDHPSNYFPTTDPCWVAFADAIQNPNLIAEQSYAVEFPSTPNPRETAMMGAVVGLAADGVPIFANFARPGDDIYEEALTFDRCGGHPQMTGVYHYHSEPYALSYDDARFIGVLRDGYPIYGRRDADGSLPTLDGNGGHTGTTIHSTTDVYHYHVNEQTSADPDTAGEMQWFLTTGTYHGLPGTCTGC